MLRTRVVTALVLLAGLLSALFYLPPNGWVAAVVLVAVGAAWEWAGLIGRPVPVRIAFAAVVAVVTPGILIADRSAATSGALVLFATSLFFWAIVAPAWLVRKWRIASSGGFFVGLLVIVPTALALVHLRTFSPRVLLAVMAVVWVADIAAYFCGRALGRHKLAPNISPGKSWEGAVGGALAVVAYGFGAATLAGHDWTFGSALLFALLLVVLAVLSVFGDLFESLAKRQIGVKDSGNLLPGHGGLLDRIDSLTATMPAVALFSVMPLLRAKLGL